MDEQRKLCCLKENGTKEECIKKNTPLHNSKNYFMFHLICEWGGNNKDKRVKRKPLWMKGESEQLITRIWSNTIGVCIEVLYMTS